MDKTIDTTFESWSWSGDFSHSKRTALIVRLHKFYRKKGRRRNKEGENSRYHH